MQDIISTVCNHIISRNGLRVPEDYSDTFRVMGENKIIPQKFTDELVNMAKFGNRLVHIYWEVDDLQLYDIERKRLGDFKILLDSLSKYLNWQNNL